jgi:hypothetical protein
VHKSEKKEFCGQPTVEARARARDGSVCSSRSRWGALAEQGEAGTARQLQLLEIKFVPVTIFHSSFLKRLTSNLFF